MARSPYARVAYLLGIDRNNLPAYMTSTYSHQSVTTPATLNGSPQSLTSYQLTIAYRNGDDWLIYDERNSATTNRHVRTTRAVIESQGYQATDETTTLRRGWDRHDIYRRYTRKA